MVEAGSLAILLGALIPLAALRWLPPHSTLFLDGTTEARIPLKRVELITDKLSQIKPPQRRLLTSK